VVDGHGNLAQDWSRCDKTFKRPHRVLISPYDPEKPVWVDDDGRCALFVFSNDESKLLQRIGTPNEWRADDRFSIVRQTLRGDGRFFVPDG
jgi:hypothetical protein